MRKIIYTAILTIILYSSCSINKKHLVKVDNDYEIDLTCIDSVRSNLNGYWLLKNEKVFSKKQYILHLDFDTITNSSFWDKYEYERTFTKEITTFSSCQPHASLIVINDSVMISFVKFLGSDTSKIDFLSKTKFKINGLSYLKYEGFDYEKY